tara:strand:+ start:1302 stop:1622 length:321 start_codon:yes stop_codon:yes gene_type:complete
MSKHSPACPECGEATAELLVKMLTMPQKPKVHSSDTKPQDRWGYNKTTTESLFAADIGRRDTTYDENALKAEVKETAKKIAGKGATVAVGSNIKAVKKAKPAKKST